MTLLLMNPWNNNNNSEGMTNFKVVRPAAPQKLVISDTVWTVRKL